MRVFSVSIVQALNSIKDFAKSKMLWLAAIFLPLFFLFYSHLGKHDSGFEIAARRITDNRSEKAEEIYFPRLNSLEPKLICFQSPYMTIEHFEKSTGRSVTKFPAIDENEVAWHFFYEGGGEKWAVVSGIDFERSFTQTCVDPSKTRVSITCRPNCKYKMEGI